MLGLMTLIWSVNFVIGKIALREFPPLSLTTLRVILSALLLWPVFFLTAAPGEGARMWAEKKKLVWLAFFGVTLNQGFFVTGLKYTNASHASIIVSLTPVFVLIVARLHGLERFTLFKVVGLCTCMAGVTLLTLSRHPLGTGTPASVVGDALIAASSLCFSYYAVLGKEVTARYSSVSLNTVAFSIGALFLLPVAIPELSHGSLAGHSLKAWLALAYMAVFASVIGYLIFYWALRQIAATRVTTLSYIQPVLVALMGFFWLGERLTLPEIAGAAVILTGVAMTERG